MTVKNNLVWHESHVTRDMREQRNGHKSSLLWFTGLSGSGKSTLAHAVELKLHQMGVRTFVFDGDNVRHGLCGDLDFSIEDRTENIRRIGEMSKLFVEAGVFALTAFISPVREDRRKVRSLLNDGDFIEVYCRCSLKTCEERDVKGLYKQARAGEIPDFTGISSPYEEPEAAEVVIDTDQSSIEDAVDIIITYLEQSDYLNTRHIGESL